MAISKEHSLDSFMLVREKIVRPTCVYVRRRLTTFYLYRSACSLCYFTLVLNASRMGGNPFLNFLYQSAIEMPSYIVGRWYGDRYGRRLTTAFSFAIAAITAFVLIVIMTS